MKLLRYFCIALLGCALLSSSKCTEPDEAPLQFDIVQNSDPESITSSYHSSCMGPFPCDKEYFIYTGFGSGDIVLQCTNCRVIEIETSLSKPCVLEGGGSSSTEATAEETGIYVTLSGANVINIHFADRTGVEYYGLYGTIQAYGKVDGREETAVINITRSQRLTAGE